MTPLGTRRCSQVMLQWEWHQIPFCSFVSIAGYSELLCHPFRSHAGNKTSPFRDCSLAAEINLACTKLIHVTDSCCLNSDAFCLLKAVMLRSNVAFPQRCGCLSLSTPSRSSNLGCEVSSSCSCPARFAAARRIPPLLECPEMRVRPTRTLCGSVSMQNFAARIRGPGPTLQA